MRKIRIGNDVEVQWEVKTGGEALSLEGRELKVYVRSAYSRQEVDEFSVEGCVVSFVYKAERQKTTGARSVELADVTEGSARRTVCADEAFQLVAHTCEEDTAVETAAHEDFDRYLVSLRSNVLVGRPGMSAYDLWLADGHTGTREDYMKWLREPADEAAESVAEAEAERTKNEEARKAAETARNAAFEEKTAAAEKAAADCEKATEGAEKVNVALSDDNVLTATDRTGTQKSVSLAEAADVKTIVDDVAHLNETMGAYSERESITLTAKETDKAISADGVKVSKKGWAIAEFTAEKGNVYLIKPGETDGSVCIFAEKITSVETRGIDYTYTYNEDGTVASATATYLGKTHSYAYEWTMDAQGDKTATITEDGAVVQALPMTYETQVGTYAPLVRLNADAELPKDGYCRYMSHFKGNSAIKIAVSYKADAADPTMKVTRDGVLASISTQLGNLSQKEDETRNRISEIHESYIDVKFSNGWTVVVDGKEVTVPTMTKTRLKPKRAFQIFRDSDVGKVLPLLHYNIAHLDTREFERCFRMFSGCSGLTSLDVSGWDTSKVQNMMNMFSGCSGLTSLDVSGWDTSKVQNMMNMFSGCSGLTSLDVSGWDTSKVQSFWGLFYGCTGLTSLDVSGWKIQSGASLHGTFDACSKLKFLDLSGWIIPNGSDVERLFNGCQSIKTLKLGKKFFSSTNNFGDSRLDQLLAWTDSSVRESLVVNSYDRKANGLGNLALPLHANTKKVLTEDDIATMTAKGYIIA